MSVRPPVIERKSEIPIIPTVTKEVTNTEKTCYKHTAGDDQNQYVKIADKISNHELEFLATLDGENPLWTPDRQSDVWLKKGENGKNQICRGDHTDCWREQSFGFCQVHKPDHPEIVNNPKFFSDPEWQLQTCYEMYKGGVTFYGKKQIPKTIKHFTCTE